MKCRDKDCDASFKNEHFASAQKQEQMHYQLVHKDLEWLTSARCPVCKRSDCPAITEPIDALRKPCPLAKEIATVRYKE